MMDKGFCELNGGKWSREQCSFNPEKVSKGLGVAGRRVSGVAKPLGKVYSSTKGSPRGVIPQWLFTGIALLVLLLGLYLGGPMLFASAGFVVLGYVLLNSFKMFKERSGSDVAILIIELLFFTILVMVLGLGSSVPWWKIILVGLLAEGLAFLTGFLPVVGDYAGAITIFLLTYLVFDGFPGLIYGLIGGFLALIPLSVPGLIFGAYLLVKLLTG